MQIKLNEKLSHFKYCKIGKIERSNQRRKISFNYKGVSYTLNFSDSRIIKDCGYSLTRNDGKFVDTDLLIWLSVYFGEDAVDPFSEPDSRFVSTRGTFDVYENHLQNFISKIEGFPRKSYPKWKQDLLNMALVYYSSGLRSGVNMMPISLGLFSVSLECLGNSLAKSHKINYSLGEKHFKGIILKRLKRYKQNVKYKESVKRFEKYMDRELEVIHVLRNSYYGHYLLYLPDNKRDVRKVLLNWYVRNGANKKFAKSSFKIKRIHEDVMRESHALYKVALKYNRLLIFYFLGYSQDIPFASHDFSLIGETRTNEVIALKSRRA